MKEVHRHNGEAAGHRLKNVVVMKFGGTSVQDAPAIRRLVQIVRSRARFSRLVVVSALAKVTDQLISLGKLAAEEKLDVATQSLAALCRRHEQLAFELLNKEDYLRVYSELKNDFQVLGNLLSRIAENHQLSPQFQDHLAGFGECLSSRIVSAALRQANENAALVDSRSCLVTDSCYTRAAPLWEQTQERVEMLLQPLLAEGKVPVLGGFIGADPDGIPTTLGRGGSDFSATILGAALHAHRIEIWTDVDGVLTADPKLCPDARLIPRMSFGEASELAQCGAKVLHPSTLIPAMRENIPVFVLNSANPANRGTEIVSRANSGYGVRSVTLKRNVATVEIATETQVDPSLLEAVYSAFERHHGSLDWMECSRSSISLVVGSTAGLPAIADDLRGVASMSWKNHQALVCLVGENIRRRPDIVNGVFATVSDMDVRLACQSPSGRSIGLLVDESRAEESVQRLHSYFFPPCGDREEPMSTCYADALVAGQLS